ncbi:hypothetical protein V1522DRAFT_395750 [Lipomyces starkeyi]
MDSNSDLQNTQGRSSRTKRPDYYAMNLGTDSEGDSDEGLRSRSRRRLDVSQSSTVSDDIVSPDESASQVLAVDAESNLSLSPIIRSRPMPPKSWVWEHFQTTELETTYIHKSSKKSRPDRLITCTRCSWNTTDAVLQGSSGNLNAHLSSQHKIFKPGTSMPLSTPRASSDITSFLLKRKFLLMEIRKDLMTEARRYRREQEMSETSVV